MQKEVHWQSGECKLGWFSKILFGVVFLVSCFFFYLAFVPNSLDADFQEDAGLQIVVVILTVGSVALFIDSLHRKISWDDKGVVVRRVLRRELFIPWSDIVDFNLRSWLPGFAELKLANGQSVHLYETMDGLGPFKLACLRYRQNGPA